MSASAEMPYFIKPSINVSPAEKRSLYDAALQAIDANLSAESNLFLKMVTINALLKTYLPHYYWVGFYIMDEGKLKVGPYQGTLGCLYIELNRGVCGKAATTGKTQIVGEVHSLAQGTDHIACDPNSQSEIVVPVFDAQQNLIAVFDVDSTLPYSFDEIDQMYLEQMMKKHFTVVSLKTNYSLN